MVTTLNEFKENSRIDAGLFSDAYLTNLLSVAEQMVENATRTTFAALTPTGGTLPTPLKHACLMMADHLLTHNGATSPVDVHIMPLGVAEMIKPYVQLCATE